MRPVESTQTAGPYGSSGCSHSVHHADPQRQTFPSQTSVGTPASPLHGPWTMSPIDVFFRNGFDVGFLPVRLASCETDVRPAFAPPESNRNQSDFFRVNALAVTAASLPVCVAGRRRGERAVTCGAVLSSEPRPPGVAPRAPDAAAELLCGRRTASHALGAHFPSTHASKPSTASSRLAQRCVLIHRRVSCSGPSITRPHRSHRTAPGDNCTIT